MKRGFTLIELLVVVLIIGILASVALPQYSKAVEKSRTTEAKTMLKSMGDAVTVYILENGSDPTTFADLAVSFTDEGGSTATGNTFNTKNFQYSMNNAVGEFSCLAGSPGYPLVAKRRENSNSYMIYHCPKNNLMVCIDDVYSGQVADCKKAGFSVPATECITGGHSCWQN